MLHAPVPTACSSPLITRPKHSSSSLQLGSKTRSRQGNRFLCRRSMLITCNGKPNVIPNVMQDQQSAGTEKKHGSQDGRAQNIHCDNVTPLGSGNWRIIFSMACKRTLLRNALPSNSQGQRPAQAPGPAPGPPPGPHAQSNGGSHCQPLFLSCFSNLGSLLLLE